MQQTKYYYNPDTDGLIVVDMIDGKVENVVQLTDPVTYEIEDEIEDGPEDTPEQEPAKPPKQKTETKGVRKCSKCGKPGHIARHCPEEEGSDGPGDPFVKRMVAMMRSGNDQDAIWRAMHEQLTAEQFRVKLEEAEKIFTNGS